MSHFERKQLLKLPGSLLTLLVLLSGSAAPVEADAIGVSLDTTDRLTGLTILDQSALDLNPAVGVVGFSQTVRGFEISGTVLAPASHPAVAIRDTVIRCADASDCGVLPLVFFRSFSLTLGRFTSVGTDDILGVFSNPGGPLSSGAGIDFQGFISGEGVGRGFTFAAWSNWPWFSFYHKDIDVRGLENGEVPVDGLLNVTLPGEGDALRLNYAYVSIPEPATFLFAGIGTVFIVAARRRIS